MVSDRVEKVPEQGLGEEGQRSSRQRGPWESPEAVRPRPQEGQTLWLRPSRGGFGGRRAGLGRLRARGSRRASGPASPGATLPAGPARGAGGSLPGGRAPGANGLRVSPETKAHTRLGGAGAGCSRTRRPPDRRRGGPRTHTLGFKALRPKLTGAGRALTPREPLPRLPETARARRWGAGPGGAGRSAAAGSQGLPLPQFATVRLCFASRGTGLPPANSNSRFQTVSGESLEGASRAVESIPAYV